MKVINLKRIHTLSFNLYENLEKANLIHSNRKEAYEWLPGTLSRGLRELLQVMEIFYILVVVVGTHMYTYVKFIKLYA